MIPGSLSDLLGDFARANLSSSCATDHDGCVYDRDSKRKQLLVTPLGGDTIVTMWRAPGTFDGTIFLPAEACARCVLQVTDRARVARVAAHPPKKGRGSANCLAAPKRIGGSSTHSEPSGLHTRLSHRNDVQSLDNLHANLTNPYRLSHDAAAPCVTFSVAVTRPLVRGDTR